MTYLGTRPPTLDEWNKYELHHRARLAIKPGIHTDRVQTAWEFADWRTHSDFYDAMVLAKVNPDGPKFCDYQKEAFDISLDGADLLTR